MASTPPPLRPQRQQRGSRDHPVSRWPLTTARTRPERRRSGCNSIFIGLAAMLLLGVFVIFAFTRFVLGGSVIEDPEPLAASGTSLASADSAEARVEPRSIMLDPFTVLLLGVDSRDSPDEGARSDTLIVVHVNPQEKWASMLSIPRDTLTQIPGFGQLKINAAYTLGHQHATDLYGSGITPTEGGGALARKTVEQFLGIQIDYTAQVDFQGFVKVVETMGGLTIDIPQALLDPEYPTENFGFERLYVPAGLTVLDGETALRYARSRHSGTDFDRSCRQQRVLQAMLREIRQRDLLAQVQLLPNIVADIQESVKTTMPIDNLGVLVGLAELAQNLSRDRIQQYSINPDNVGILFEDASYSIRWNPNDIEVLVAKMLAGPVEETDAIPMVQVQNGAGVRGLATRVTRHLSTQGFTMIEPADAPGYYEHSIIIDYAGYPEIHQQLAAYLGIDSDYIQATPAPDAPPAPYNTDIVLVLGEDYQERWTTISEYAPTAPPPAPAVQAAEEVPNLPPSCSPDF